MAKKDSIDLVELRELVRSIIEEDMGPSMTPGAHRILNLGSDAPKKSTPPPLPPGAPGAKKPSAPGAQPQALNKFKADAKMVVDAAQKMQAAMDGANTNEALKWLDRVIQFATSAKNTLGGPNVRKEQGPNNAIPAPINRVPDPQK